MHARQIYRFHRVHEIFDQLDLAILNFLSSPEPKAQVSIVRPRRCRV